MAKKQGEKMETKENKKICVITGGGSGMGLAAAKYMPKDKVIIVSGIGI